MSNALLFKQHIGIQTNRSHALNSEHACACALCLFMHTSEWTKYVNTYYAQLLYAVRIMKMTNLIENFDMVDIAMIIRWWWLLCLHWSDVCVCVFVVCWLIVEYAHSVCEIWNSHGQPINIGKITYIIMYMLIRHILCLFLDAIIRPSNIQYACVDMKGKKCMRV